MSELFINQDLVFKKKDSFSCVYNNRTGWFLAGGVGLWKFLESFYYGRDTNAPEEKFDPKLKKLLLELTKHRYLLSERGSELREYLNFYPIRTFYTVFYQRDNETDIAVQRKGPFGAVDFEIITIEGFGEALWNLCDGHKKVKDVISILTEETGESHRIVKRRVLERLWEWASLDVQIMKLLPSSISSYTPAPPQLIAPAPFIPSLKTPPPKLAKDVREYHVTGITGAYEQFERVESTLSHIYRIPHPILGGKSYGNALLSRILDRTSIEKGCRILEVGGGHGDVSKDILQTLKAEKREVYAGLTYIVYDLAPRLIESQRRLHEKAGTHVEHIHGDGERLALADESIDIVLSNEVIADFPTPEMTLQEVKELPDKYGIPVDKHFMGYFKNAPDRFRLNLGAFLLLKEIERVLKPGGLAVVTEYGYQDRLAFRAKHLDHAEYAIHFGHMVSIANALSLNVELTDAFRFLNFRQDVELMTYPSFQAAFRILERNGAHLPNIVYTQELLRDQLGKKAESFENIRYVKCRREPFEIVKVLICTKPLNRKKIKKS